MNQKSSKHHGERVIIVIKGKNLTLSVKIVLLLAISCFLAISCYGLFRYHVTDYCDLERKIMKENFDIDQYYQTFEKQAKNIKIYTDDKNERQKLNQLLKQRDKYTSLQLLDSETGEYLTGGFGQVLDEPIYLMMPLSILQSDFEQYSYNLLYCREIAFKDCDVLLYVTDLHDLKHIKYYFYTALFTSLMVFLLPTFIFIRRKVKYINCLKNEILNMSHGDLMHPITIQSHDELSILAKEMDDLRITLHTNIQKEADMKQAHYELISSLSHDLRTPLTSLLGYLEILTRQRYDNEIQMNDYLHRCIEKVNQIKDLSNKTFEYALVFDHYDQVEFSSISSLEILDYLEENLEYLFLDGYTIEKNIDRKDTSIKVDLSMMKRMINNLFSNIHKYADITKPVIVCVEMKQNQMKMTLSNEKKECQYIESHQIGLKSVKRIVELHHGQLFIQDLKESFTIVLTIPYHL